MFITQLQFLHMAGLPFIRIFLKLPPSEQEYPHWRSNSMQAVHLRLRMPTGRSIRFRATSSGGMLSNSSKYLVHLLALCFDRLGDRFLNNYYCLRVTGLGRQCFREKFSSLFECTISIPFIQNTFLPFGLYEIQNVLHSLLQYLCITFFIKATSTVPIIVSCRWSRIRQTPRLA